MANSGRSPTYQSLEETVISLRRFSPLYHWVILVALVFTFRPVAAQTPANTPAATPAAATTATTTAPVPDAVAAQVEALLAQMSPADRVGQLFVVTFEGADLDFDSPIVELIHGYRVGGVVISPWNLNFTNEKGVDTPAEVATLANQLQAAAYGVLLPAEQALDPVPFAPWPPRGLQYLPTETGAPPSNLPLLIGVQQLGDGLPGTALRRGFSALPSQMALGAAWNPLLAKQVGDIVGRELRTVGANLLVGPNLDVFDEPGSEQVGNLGIFSFGGNAFWVSQLGRAYIEGVHNGAQGRVATVARHFPGQGNTDRPPEEEVATIQKSLDEMRTVALPPFIAVTRSPSSVVAADGDPASTDILMTSHMRFSAFQGGAASRVTPISLAPELRNVLTQEGFDDWRAAGGLIMSNALGQPAIRRFYGAASPDFFSRRVALDAFTAGNDLLFLSDFSLDDNWETEYANIKSTIGFFQERYGNDPDFARQVDDSVRRILQLKLGIYRDSMVQPVPDAPVPAAASDQLIPLTNLLVDSSQLIALEGLRTEAEGVVGDVARGSISILYPDPATQTDPLPPTFRADDRILIFSDSRLQRECSTCTAEAAIGPDEIADIIKRLYGADATGQIDPALVTSLTFADLTMFLNSQEAPTATSPLTGTALATSTVAAVAPLTATSLVTTAIPPGADLEPPSPDAVEARVAERNAKTASLIQNANWIIFAMLDVEPISRPSSDAVQRFLREYANQLADQRLVVFALNAPYFLDATEMSRLTIYYGVYSKAEPFLESAVRALFRAFTPSSAPPVNVPGTRFASLAARLSPDPAESVPLQVEDAAGTVLLDSGNSEAAVANAAEAPAGATLSLVAGPIVDWNGNIVPDGTLVTFRLQYEGDALALRVEPAPSRGGVAMRDVLLDRSGTLRIAAEAGDATSGDPLSVVILPPPTPTPSPASGVAAQGEAGGDGETAPVDRASIVTLLIALLTILVTLSLFLIVQVRVLPRATLVRNMLWAAIFGLAGYILYATGLIPGSDWLRSNVSVWGTSVVVLVPMLLPLLWLGLRSDDK